MNSVLKKADSLVQQFREQTKDATFTEITLQQFCGPECVGTISLKLGEVENQIHGCICEGFDVSWRIEGGTLTLRVSEE